MDNQAISEQVDHLSDDEEQIIKIHPKQSSVDNFKHRQMELDPSKKNHGSQTTECKSSHDILIYTYMCIWRSTQTNNSYCDSFNSR